MKTVTKEPEDHLAYVRRRLQETPPRELTRIAADADLSLRTLYNIRDGKNEGGQYHTIMTLHETLRQREVLVPPKRRKKP